MTDDRATTERATADPADWFLTAAERGNPATAIDRRRHGGLGWTAGNEVVVHIDGAAYFTRLHRVLQDRTPGDHVWFTDWAGNADERLAGAGTELSTVLGALADLGVVVRGLLWRSHPKEAGFDQQDNMFLAAELNEHGASLVLDQRVRRGGSHHQKMVVIGRGDPIADEAGSTVDTGPGDTGSATDGLVADLAFAGGIDLCHGRRDDRDHLGDPQPTDELDEVYGPQPAWHEVQLEVRGPAAGDLAWTFRERWHDPQPLDKPTPLRALRRRLARQPEEHEPLPVPAVDVAGDGPHLVQVLRTYPARRPPYPFAPDGERSIAAAHLKALRRARRLVVIEDQYLWSLHSAGAVAAALRAHPELQVVVVVPRHPDQTGTVIGPANRLARRRYLHRLRAAGGDRVAVYDLVNREGAPIYVHAKVCIIDDVWLEVGSDNVNRRSWTHDSEVGCAVLDERLDPRHPTDPGALGDGARVLARDTRLSLWREHLGRADGDDADLVDPGRAVDVLRRSARQLTEWEHGDRSIPRPPGHLTVHTVEPVHRWLVPLADLTYRKLLDPDGSPHPRTPQRRRDPRRRRAER